MNGEASASKDRDKKVEDFGQGQDMAAISSSLIKRYNLLSSYFTKDQKRMADSLNLASGLELLKTIADTTEETLKMAKEEKDKAIQQKKEAIKNSKRDNIKFYISLAINVVLGVLALIRI